MSQYLKQETRPMNDAGSSQIGFENRRQFVRVYYPTLCPQHHRPELVIRYRTYRVLDISEAGIRFSVPTGTLFRSGTITASLKFPDETSIEIYGEIVRRVRNQIALKLSKGIPYSRIMAEQLRLRNLAANGVISTLE